MTDAETYGTRSMCRSRATPGCNARASGERSCASIQAASTVLRVCVSADVDTKSDARQARVALLADDAEVHQRVVERPGRRRPRRR